LSSITPWFVWCLRIGSASFFDLGPEDRGWEIDPKILVPLLFILSTNSPDPGNAGDAD
jgi:hypothetical protein